MEEWVWLLMSLFLRYLLTTMIRYKMKFYKMSNSPWVRIIRTLRYSNVDQDDMSRTSSNAMNNED